MIDLPELWRTTAEFLSMWALMMVGPNPFFVDEETGELRMQLLPALPRAGFLTIPMGRYHHMFRSSCLVPLM
jgi:hypothetical protein